MSGFRGAAAPAAHSVWLNILFRSGKHSAVCLVFFPVCLDIWISSECLEILRLCIWIYTVRVPGHSLYLCLDIICESGYMYSVCLDLYEYIVHHAFASEYLLPVLPCPYILCFRVSVSICVLWYNCASVCKSVYSLFVSLGLDKFSLFVFISSVWMPVFLCVWILSVCACVSYILSNCHVFLNFLCLFLTVCVSSTCVSVRTSPFCVCVSLLLFFCLCVSV